jgi:hypothetical protein
MKISSTLLLAALLSGLSGYYFFWLQPSQKALTDMSPVGILQLAEGDKISWLEIQNEASKEKVALKREGEEWKIESPVSYPAQELLVEGMIEGLMLSQRLRRIPFDERNAGALGLSTPAIKISIKTDKDPTQKVLLLGGTSPVKERAYARWEGENEYFLIPGELKAALGLSLYSLRKKKLFEFKNEALSWLHLKAGGKEFRIERKGEGWRWALPALKGEIGLEKVSDLIYALDSLFVKEFLDGQSPEASPFGLRKRESFLAAGPQGQAGERIFLGSRARGKDALYVLRQKEKLVLLVSERNLRTVVESFELTFQEIKGENTRKSSDDSAKDREGGRAGGAEPLPGHGGSGDEERFSRADSGSV